jgi:glycine/D-amino acid oxidase-like deaminating enzyme
MSNIIVIGAGIIGASVAYRLAQAGATVSVLDAGRVGGGTTAHSYSWVNAHDKLPRSYFALNLAGQRAHHALRDEFESTPWWHDQGYLEWPQADGHEAYRAKVARLQSWGYTAEWLDARQLAELEPDLAPGAAGEAPVAWFARDGWVDPVVYTQTLLSLARRRYGVQVRQHTAVAQVVVQAGRVSGVTLADGTPLPADWVVNCTGPQADSPAFAPELRVPLAPSLGLLVFTPPVASGLNRMLSTPGGFIRPDGAGRLLLWRSAFDDGLTADTPPDITQARAQALVDAAAALLPGIGRVAPEAVRIGVRAIPRDQLPAIGTLPHAAGYYTVVTHSGVTLAPYLGEAVADEILNGTSRVELADFRPTRFFG